MPLASAALSFNGTAAVGAPIANQGINARCTDGTRFRATTDAQGRFTVAPAAAASLPCMFQLTTASGNTLFSIATAAGTINITPLTNALVYAVSGISSPITRFNSPSPSTFRDGLTPDSVAKAKAVVNNMIKAEYGLTAPAGADFLTSSFNANSVDPLDKLLDDIKAADIVRDTLSPTNLQKRPNIIQLAASLSNNLISTADGRFSAVFGKNEIEDQTNRGGSMQRRPAGVRIEQFTTSGECSSALVIAGQRVAMAKGNSTTYFTLPATLQGNTSIEAYVNGTTGGLPMAEGVRRDCGANFIFIDSGGEILVRLNPTTSTTTILRSYMNGSRAVQTKVIYNIPAAAL